MIHQDAYETFLESCRDIERRRERVAKPALTSRLLPRVGPDATNAELLAHIIAEALLRRIDRNLVESKNIYLESFDIPQIELFSSLGTAVPLVPASHAIANQYLLQVLREEKRASVFEIGVGRGAQLAALLRELSRDRGRLEELRIVAFDPDRNNVSSSEGVVNALKPELGFAVEYHGVVGLLEKLTESELRALGELLGPRPAVNASFTLHHTVHPIQDYDFRTRLLARMNEYIRPGVFTLIEPHANHDTEGLTRRLHESWLHFGTVFDLVDRADVQAEHRFVIKEKFFGREIRDIFGTSDMFRCERHEPVENWLLRLAKAGFEPFIADPPITINLPDYCSSRATEGLVRIGYSDVPVVAIIATRPASGGRVAR